MFLSLLTCDVLEDFLITYILLEVGRGKIVVEFFRLAQFWELRGEKFRVEETLGCEVDGLVVKDIQDLLIFFAEDIYFVDPIGVILRLLQGADFFLHP